MKTVVARNGSTGCDRKGKASSRCFFLSLYAYFIPKHWCLAQFCVFILYSAAEAFRPHPASGVNVVRYEFYILVGSADNFPM
jgi:hypothetical protein